MPTVYLTLSTDGSSFLTIRPAYAGTDFIIARDGGLPPFISFSTGYSRVFGITDE
jgi:hypothetical protein